jgi:hypothetical protein
MGDVGGWGVPVSLSTSTHDATYYYNVFYKLKGVVAGPSCFNSTYGADMYALLFLNQPVIIIFFSNNRKST